MGEGGGQRSWEEKGKTVGPTVVGDELQKNSSSKAPSFVQKSAVHSRLAP